MFQLIKSKNAKPIITLAILYTIGNFLFLLNRGLYWDGWVWMYLIKEKNYALLWDFLNQAKLFTAYFLFRVSGLTNDPILFLRILSFVSWLLAGIFLYNILRKKLSLRIDRSFFISAAFILIPLYLVKIELSITHYSVNNMLFFLAAFSYFTAEKINNKIASFSAYALSFVLFFFSFFTNTFLVFYGGFLLLLLLFFYQKNKELPPLKILRLWIKNNCVFLILPIIFWAARSFFWEPEGTYAYYYQYISFDIASLKSLIQNLWQNIFYGLFWPIIAALPILERKIFATFFLIIGAATYLLTKKIFYSNNSGDGDSDADKNDFNPKIYLLAGCFLFILGAIPYLAMGKTPHIFGNGFSMRHALLLPLGSSLIILSAILAFIKKQWQPFAQIMILSLFSTFTIYNYYWQDMDWYKQEAIIGNLKETESETIKNASSLIFHDKVGIYWQNRNIRGEEYFGYIRSAFPKDNIKFATTEEYDPVEQYQSAVEMKTHIFVFPPNFNPGKKIVDIDIVSESTREITTVSNWLKIKKSQIFSDKSIFLKNIKDIYQIKVVPSPKIIKNP